MTHQVYLGLGSNLGDREGCIRKAIELIGERVGAVVRQSSLIETEPWGFESENRFLNGVILCETTLTPQEVLKATQQIEKELGKRKKHATKREKTSHPKGRQQIIHSSLFTFHFKDRPIDIDILLYDDLQVDEPNLKIPHPLMQERDFVMIPLREIKTTEQMKKIILTLVATMALLGTNAQNPYKKYTENLPFPMPEVKAPVFPETKLNVQDFGADPTGTRLCTEAFAKAIETLYGMGGGHLIVPRGVWYTGPIQLKSNIDLHLEHGAIIRFAADERLYPIISTSFEGLDTRRCQSPLSANNATNVAITGYGAIDGNGQYWRPLKRTKVTDSQWNTITAQKGGVETKKGYWVPSEGYAKAEKNASMNVPKATTDEEWEEIKRFLRPVMVSIVNCKNVLLQGVIFQNSPAWNIHPLMCQNVIIDNILARNPSYAQNGDALDLESCSNCLIVNSKFDAGDDGICIKSGKDADGRKRGMPCQNVVVDGCTVFAGHGGFVVGSEMSGGVRNFKVQNCQFLGTEVGLRFKSTRGRGGIVENIYIDGISMMDISTVAIIFNMYYGGKSVAELLEAGETPNNLDKQPVNEGTPVFRNINIQNVACNGAGKAMEFNGLPEMPIDRINLKNISIRARKDATFDNCKNIKKENVNITIEE